MFGQIEFVCVVCIERHSDEPRTVDSSFMKLGIRDE